MVIWQYLLSVLIDVLCSNGNSNYQWLSIINQEQVKNIR